MTACLWWFPRSNPILNVLTLPKLKSAPCAANTVLIWEWFNSLS